MILIFLFGIVSHLKVSSLMSLSTLSIAIFKAFSLYADSDTPRIASRALSYVSPYDFSCFKFKREGSTLIPNY